MSTKAPQRLLFVDVLRGLAVLYMVQLHTSHGWLLPEARRGNVWDAAQFFGGLAAPLFLLLAGAGLGLKWRLPANDAAGDTYQSVARGAELLVLGYALRLQMWIIDGAAYARFKTYPGIVLLAAGYGLAYLCATRVVHGRPCPKRMALAAAAAVLAGLAWAYTFDGTRADGLIRVDVLQCLGASLILLSTLGARNERRRSAYYAALALAVALATPLVQSWMPGPLPAALAGYLAQWPSADGQRVLSLFPLFPWLSYAAIGVAVGLAWGRAQTTAELGVCWEMGRLASQPGQARSRRRRTLEIRRVFRRSADAESGPAATEIRTDPFPSRLLELLLVRLMAVGALLALVANPSWAPVRLLALPESIVALARVTYKAALCCVMVGPALALAAAPKLMRGPLTQLGRSSLLVYWVHLQFAFGTVSRPLARSLTLEAWIYGTVVLMACMWGLAALRSARLTRMFRELTQAARNRLKSRISPAI